jgi:superfamily II DNA helicase RecQ
MLPAIFDRIPFIALSGTLTKDQMRTLPDILGLLCPALVQETPDRTNIFLSKIMKVKSSDMCGVYEEIFKEECELLHKDPKTYPITLMFMPLYYISQAAAYLMHLFGPCDITKSCYSVLYSRQEKAVIKTTVEELHLPQPRIRLVLTSSVAGMGFDPPCIERVIHAKPPRSLSQYLQEIGRAGRRGQPSKAILYCNKQDVAKNLPGIQDNIVEYCNNDVKCLREMLLEPFGFLKSDNIDGDKCCSYCKKQTSCTK